jgi:hypothetical protein
VSRNSQSGPITATSVGSRCFYRSARHSVDRQVSPSPARLRWPSRSGAHARASVVYSACGPTKAGAVKARAAAMSGLRSVLTGPAEVCDRLRGLAAFTLVRACARPRPTGDTGDPQVAVCAALRALGAPPPGAHHRDHRSWRPAKDPRRSPLHMVACTRLAPVRQPALALTASLTAAASAPSGSRARRTANTGVFRAWCNRRATSSASLVLPIPPEPINVTNRAGPIHKAPTRSSSRRRTV